MVTENNTKLLQIIFLFRQSVYYRDQEIYAILVSRIQIWYGAIFKNQYLKNLFTKIALEKIRQGRKQQDQGEKKENKVGWEDNILMALPYNKQKKY